MNQFHYRCIRCEQMTQNDILQAATLFSENYGKWSPASGRTGNVKMSANRMKDMLVEKPDRYIVMVFAHEQLVGYAFYLKRKTREGKTITWILQLVVKKEFRGQHIGTKLMHSIWGMSDSWAWGLYTANPLTIKALEDATMRRVNIRSIDAHLNEIKEVAYDLFDDTAWIDYYADGIVSTDFYVDHSDAVEKIGLYYSGRKFGLPKELPEGKEWLAFVFNDQKPKATEDQMNMLLSFSMDVLRNAYSRMNMGNHGWASHASEEVTFFLSKFGNIRSVLDVGCGNGRHCYEFAKHKIRSYGIDLVQERLCTNETDIADSAKYVRLSYADARCYRSPKKVDAAICVYDVIGSFPKENDNLQILQSIARNLKL